MKLPHGLPDAGRRRVAQALAGLPAAQRRRLGTLPQRYYADMDARDLDARSPQTLLAAITAHLALGHRRLPGAPALRVYDPESARDGWSSPHTVVDVVTDDMPFLVDSLVMELERRGLAPLLVAHPVVAVRRQGDGTLLKLDVDGGGTGTEAWMHFELPRVDSAAARGEIEDALLRVLAQVRTAVTDWTAIRTRMLEVADALAATPQPVPEAERDEAVAFLRWLTQDHFTFLAAHRYALGARADFDLLRPLPGSGLGLLRPGGGLDRRLDTIIPAAFRPLVRAPALLVLTKSTARSPVHRPAQLDYVGVKRYDARGRLRGEWRFLGLYTSSMYNARPVDIPLLRRKVAQVLELSGLPPLGHSAKALMHILETFPRDEMLQASVEELATMAAGVLTLRDRRRLRLFIRREVFGRYASALLYVPRDRYRTELREYAQRLLMETLGGESCAFGTQFSEAQQVRVHYAIRVRPEHAPQYDVAALESQLAQAMLTWSDRLHAALVERHGETTGAALGATWAEAFPAAYQADCTPQQAVADIAALASRSAQAPLAFGLTDRTGGYRLRIAGTGEPLALSDVLPRIEHFGLRVLEARPYELAPAGAAPAFVLDFELTAADTPPAQKVSARFEAALGHVLQGRLEDDGLNRLVLAADLDWREVMLLRAITRHLLQLQVPFSQAYMEQCLARHPRLVRALVDLHHLRLDPARHSAGARAHTRLEAVLAEGLDAVTSLDDDRILRRYLGHVQAMLRSNYFRAGPDGASRDHLAFKLDARALAGIPEPRPRYEIFVYAPHVEGVHLRGGPVARGGIRHSDRREDFRTEILGLMKAQTVKNAVIVPVGAKGGFVVKRPLPEQREAREAVVRACYVTLIRGLLDLTDNRAGARVLPPPQVVRHDGDDPYLVVAADKGTATFSDLANATAAEYGFWLDDAFASGGSTGYDHKAMGITARGAWESVLRHFRELGLDERATPFTVAGIGDISGDVFGNGMLRSQRIRLVAAFDHRHIFLDPDPDPQVSYQERARLHALPRSSWADYDPRLISRGGGVYPRAAKSVPLSARVRKVLGVPAAALTPPELIRAILRAPVDLLWNGGIGTYVKASDETHAAVGDRANDAVRVDARELRCRVVAEGGNLGLTQRARIEYARGGGRINTDAIDNSAGVDCSDHEVNLKILLGGLERSRRLTRGARNRLLRAMTGAVAASVLRDNYEQALALSVESAQAAYLLDEHARLLHVLERAGLKRDLEHLPDDAALAARATEGQGLTRPELAVLLAHAKLHFYGQLVQADLGRDPELAPLLALYFPPALRRRYRAAVAAHPLRREILATYLVNRLVNRMGPTFAARMMDETGASAVAVMRAAATAARIYDLPTLWAGIEALDDTVPGALQVELLVDTRRLLERVTLWLLRRPRLLEPAHAPGRALVQRLENHLPELLGASESAALARRCRELEDAGAPAALAHAVARLDPLYAALDIGALAGWKPARALDTATTWFALAEVLEVPWLRGAVRSLPRLHHWQRKARAALRDELYSELAALAAQVLRAGRRAAAATRVELWRARAGAAPHHYAAVLAEIKSGKGVDLPSLTVAVGELRALARR